MMAARPVQAALTSAATLTGCRSALAGCAGAVQIVVVAITVLVFLAASGAVGAKAAARQWLRRPYA